MDVVVFRTSCFIIDYNAMPETNIKLIGSRPRAWLLTLVFLMTIVMFVDSASAAATRTIRRPSSSKTSSSRSRGRRGGSSSLDDSEEDEESSTTTSSHSRGKSTKRSGGSTKWSNYISKFDIPKVHGAGVYVDLGSSASVGVNNYYNMPGGRCPVVGKTIVLEYGGYFLEPVNAQKPENRGLAFPETTQVRRSGTAPKDDLNSISPVSAATLRRWTYDNESDIANCAEYAKNVVPGSDRGSSYRYPWVYDSHDKMCYLLYSGIQYNQGSRYCDRDNDSNAGFTSLACMYPMKSADDAHMYFGSSNVYMDFEKKCPMHPVRDAIYGRWMGSSCVKIDPVMEEDVDSFEECAQLLFDNSASDVIDLDSPDNKTEIEKFNDALSKMDLTTVANTIFDPLSPQNPRHLNRSHGVGINWANYDSETKKCQMINKVPTCLIINAGSFALTSIGSPLESDADPYPCNIDTLGYVVPKKYGKEATITTALTLDTLQCDQYSHRRYSQSCGYYYECNSTPGFFHKYRWFLIFAAVFVLTIAILWLWRHLYSSKRSDRSSSENYERLLSKYDYDSATAPKQRGEEKMQSEAYIWGEGAHRESQITPVHIKNLH
ncbi:Apical membrane antigen 1 [Babesia duncani]|uniref:Apical membrane antigen 1 n=1 Tax=Babesia duncani TaxID=323732 RepID=A0AAD9PJ91_9APIC|nr:Apical membrane antigen 1 [Babesia duncani]